jgi:hypothetical protein
MIQETSQELTKTNIAFSLSDCREGTVADLVGSLQAEVSALWWSCDRAFPVFETTCSSDEQGRNEKKMERMVDGLIAELKRMPRSADERLAWQERLRPGLVDFAMQSVRLEERHIDFIEASGLLQASQEFAGMARRFDPAIPAEDIYQAGRNVMSANLIQLIFGLPVAVTPSIFAYSLLYPYTDNYLDDPGIPYATKVAFNRRFQHRLQGELVPPANPHEDRISQLVGLIEGEWERGAHPQVYDSLLAIHAAQARSLGLVAPDASPYELDVLGVSFEKGGTSVLADGYLAAGNLTFAQARLLYGYGAFTQLMDDLEDLRQDRTEGRMTVFSQTASHWVLDGVTNHFIHFGRAVFAWMAALDPKAPALLDELLRKCLDAILIDTVSRAKEFYSRDYLREMERHLAFRFAGLGKQRGKLARHGIGIGKLVEAMMSAEGNRR